MLVCLIGFFAGIIGGMGMGGGTILIPALVLFANIDPKLAQSINLLSSIPMTLAALFIHIKNKNVEYTLVLPIALFGIVFAIGGSLLAEYLNSQILRKAFGVFLFFIGLYEIKKGVFDNNHELKGKKIGSLDIMMMDELKEFIKENNIEIVALTIPRQAAREVAKEVAEDGIKAIWNFAHTDLNMPEDVVVENVHLSESLMRLSYNIANKNGKTRNIQEG